MKNKVLSDKGFLVQTAPEKACEVLETCSTKNGLYASGGADGYNSVWARDSMISLIGATAHTKEFKNVFSKSLSTLAKHQSKLGQIPNDVDLFDEKRKKQVTFATIDSSLWFILGEHFYRKNFDSVLWKKHSENIQNALKWVQYQDAGEDLMPEQQPTSDWQDCFPHKYGHTINTQALYYGALAATGNKKLLPKLRKQVDKYLYDSSLGYYLPWHWKDHEKYQEKEEWFDSLGNLMAVVFGLASKKQSNSILDFVKRKGIAKPFPVRVISPPVRKGSKEWKDYFAACLAGEPHSYINGGIWPFVGGFYVCALAEARRFDDAENALALLAKANSLGKKKGKEWDFNEWIHPVSKKAEGGRHQTWSAGMFLAAFEAVEKRKNPLKI
jgi:glycogen debranching enzyme